MELFDEGQEFVPAGSMKHTRSSGSRRRKGDLFKQVEYMV
ncbi:hypothetical protein BFO_0177 [Tannerella forsythia 92A2]|uniref:Uncharacterized protein n=1 Tax=Tannerella forsythia (strain ATCC 43037 / JCM 10827 / CCUG 21028 A / KCTC 5666 / FDC 338) TaxID=203275 RepID=G8UIC4_TANFA|nr:hypothetical protein BFO_0177 [Tannerella forsythia 92A2]